MTNRCAQRTGPRAGHRHLHRRQQIGVATLWFAVITLLVVSVLVLHAHAAGWLEQRATVNQSRAKQAIAAAEAGLDVALSVLNADAGAPNRATHLTPWPTGAGLFTITNATLTGSPGAASAYSVTLAALSTDTPPLARLQLNSSGGSDCSNVTDVNSCGGRAQAGQVVELTPLLRNPPAVAITSGANFNSLFDAPQATIKALTTPLTNGTSLSGATSGLVWHQGDLTITGAVGSATGPVLLVVEGNLTVTAGANVQGFVFVTGNATCTSCSTPSIQGAIAVVGTHNLTVAQVAFPADTVNGPLARVRTTAARFAKVMGTWRDW